MRVKVAFLQSLRLMVQTRRTRCCVGRPTSRFLTMLYDTYSDTRRELACICLQRLLDSIDDLPLLLSTSPTLNACYLLVMSGA